MKRFCQTLTLVNDEKKIAEYCEAHKHVWPEIIQGQREIGILDMQIYRHGRLRAHPAVDNKSGKAAN